MATTDEDLRFAMQLQAEFDAEATFSRAKVKPAMPTERSKNPRRATINLDSDNSNSEDSFQENRDFEFAKKIQMELDKEVSSDSKLTSIADKTVDEDYKFAQLLQEEIGNEVVRPNQPSTSKISHSPKSIVDENWELIDPIPDVHGLFLTFNDSYFWGRLQGVEVKWSPKMTVCAGLCCYEGRGGLCSIRLSEPLLKLRPRRDLVQTLLHEMIHAFLFVVGNNKDHDAHGPEFHKHMNRINAQCGTKITVYHSFHDEVNLYKTHWWRCDGPCRERKPYFGYVKRSMNRKPQPADSWWSQHQATCGGMFIKIKEPEPSEKKRKTQDQSNGQKKPKTNISKPATPKLNSQATNSKDIRTFFGGKMSEKDQRPDNERKAGGNFGGFARINGGGTVTVTKNKKYLSDGTSQNEKKFDTNGASNIVTIASYRSDSPDKKKTSGNAFPGKGMSLSSS